MFLQYVWGVLGSSLDIIVQVHEAGFILFKENILGGGIKTSKTSVLLFLKFLLIFLPPEFFFIIWQVFIVLEIYVCLYWRRNPQDDAAATQVLWFCILSMP